MVPFIDRQIKGCALFNMKLHHVPHCLSVRLERRFHLPYINKLRRNIVKRLLDNRSLALFQAFDLFIDKRKKANVLKPCESNLVISVGDFVQEMARYLIYPFLIKPLEDRQGGNFIAWHMDICRTEDERLISLVPSSIQIGRRLGISPGNDDSRNFHDIELKPGGIEPLDLLILRNQNLSGLMTAFLNAGLLILNMISRHTDLDKPPDKITNMGLTPVAGIGIGNNKRPAISFRVGPSFFFGHSRPCKLLILIRSQ